jgi:asparagine synthetase B (glutamine-hydrolysing)
MGKKCIVLFSGGLDSRLAVKIMQEQGFEVLAVYFKLPFGCSYEKDVDEFVKENKIELKIFDCTSGKLLQEYLECLRNQKYGIGVGVNPCKDCKIFMFKKVRKFAEQKGIELIVSGEVVGERPMSQMKNAMELIEDKSGLKGRLLRPLSAKLLEEAGAEKKDLVNRDELYNISGRKRDKQIELAKKFGIKFPHPSGGCLLCEKAFKDRFNFLLERGMNEHEIKLINFGRHFLIDDGWVILGRDKKENEKLKEISKNVGELIVPETLAPSALIIKNNPRKDLVDIVKELMKAYSKQGNLKDREDFEKWRL